MAVIVEKMQCCACCQIPQDNRTSVKIHSSKLPCFGIHAIFVDVEHK